MALKLLIATFANFENTSLISPGEIDIDNGKAVHVHDMKTYGGLVLELHSLLISEKDWSECTASSTGRYCLERSAPGSH